MIRRRRQLQQYLPDTYTLSAIDDKPKDTNDRGGFHAADRIQISKEDDTAVQMGSLQRPTLQVSFDRKTRLVANSSTEDPLIGTQEAAVEGVDEGRWAAE